MRIAQPTIVEILKGLLIGLLLVVGTFPENDWVYSTGIDMPLHWVFNYIFDQRFAIGEGIVFPHGPLAFLMYPLSENILIATLTTAFLKIGLVFNIFCILEKKETNRWLIALVVAYFISLFAEFNHLVFANILLLYCNYYNHEKLGYKYLAFLLTAFAFFIKSNIAILSGLVCFSFLLYYFVKYKNYKTTALDGMAIVGLLFIGWLGMYGIFSGLINYTVGMFQLAQDNSSAVSFYPSNNWWVLSLFIVIVMLLPFVNRTKKSVYFGVLILLCHFAVWKHGMAREDVSHVYDLLYYTMISFVCLALFDSISSFKTMALSGLALFLLVFNMQFSINYSPAKYTFFGVHNFTGFISDYSSLKTRLIEQSQTNISSNKLPQSVLDTIQNNSVDIYPWDYTIVAANQLNWQPRTVIQSYASYTSWLDNKNAQHFKSPKAPSYIVWEMKKKTQDLNGSDFNSIDNRYLLNDEPASIVEIIRNYSFIYADNKFLVLKKRTIPVQTNQFNLGENNHAWGQWMPVPEKANSLIRAQLTFDKTWIQRLKRFFYKDEQFWVYLKLQNGSVHRYRIVPGNAKDGIWINPYIYNTDEHHSIKEIMFQCSNQAIITKTINVGWESIEFVNEPKCISTFFNLGDSKSGQVEVLSSNSFELNENLNWNKMEEEQRSTIFYTGTKSHMINANQFSSSFIYPLDSIPLGDLRITADCWAQSPEYNYTGNLSMVLTINDPSGNVVYNGLSFDQQLIDPSKWNNVMNSVNYQHNKANCTLGVYIWNISGKDVYIDDFRIMVQHQAPMVAQ